MLWPEHVREDRLSFHKGGNKPRLDGEMQTRGREEEASFQVGRGSPEDAKVQRERERQQGTYKQFSSAGAQRALGAGQIRREK